MSAARLARLLRLRATRHRIAAASVARAQAAIAAVDAMTARLTHLRAGLAIPSGPRLAHDLHGYAELSARLDVAQHKLSRSRTEAERAHRACVADRQVARRAEDGAVRLHETAVARAGIDAERRADAISPPVTSRRAARW